MKVHTSHATLVKREFVPYGCLNLKEVESPLVGPKGFCTCAESVWHPAYIEKGLRDAPTEWQKKNFEVVLQTTITDSIPGPQAVATYQW